MCVSSPPLLHVPRPSPLKWRDLEMGLWNVTRVRWGHEGPYIHRKTEQESAFSFTLPCEDITRYWQVYKKVPPATHTLNLWATQPWTLSHTRSVINVYCVIHISLGQMLSMTFCSNHPKCLLKQQMLQSLQLRNRYQNRYWDAVSIDEWPNPIRWAKRGQMWQGTSC